MVGFGSVALRQTVMQGLKCVNLRDSNYDPEIVGHFMYRLREWWLG